MQIDPNHFFLTSSQDIAEISKPLRQLGITYFSYLRTYPNGSRMWLLTEPAIMQNHFAKNYHLAGNMESHPHHYKPQILLWSTLPKQYIFANSRELGVAHGMYMIEPQVDYCEFYSFATNKENDNIINTYFTKVDLLKNFTKFFKHQAQEIIKRAEPHKIILPYHDDPLDFVNDYDDIDFSYSASKNTFPLPPLSSRQSECAYYLIQGKTIKAIANLTKLSPRTIEYYFQLMKFKLKCKNKAELLVKLIEIFGK